MIPWNLPCVLSSLGVHGQFLCCWSDSHILREGAEGLLLLFTLNFSLLECWGDFSPGLQSPRLPGAFGRVAYFSDSSGTCAAVGAVSKGCWGRKKAGWKVCTLGSTPVWVCKPMCKDPLVSVSLIIFVSTWVTPYWPVQRNWRPGVVRKKRLGNSHEAAERLGMIHSHWTGKRNRFKLQEGDFRQDTSKSQWQELSVCWLSGEKEACYFEESLRITCLPGRTGERLVLGKEMTDGSLCPLQPSQLWLYIP